MNSKSVTFTCENASLDKDLFYRLAYGHGEKICKYFLKYPYGLYLLRQLSERELLFLMPNNVKRRLGFPMTRVAKRGRKSELYKFNRKIGLVFRYIFPWVEGFVTAKTSHEINIAIEKMRDVGGITNGNQDQVS